jgi:hypothetical protein
MEYCLHRHEEIHVRVVRTFGPGSNDASLIERVENESCRTRWYDDVAYTMYNCSVDLWQYKRGMLPLAEAVVRIELRRRCIRRCIWRSLRWQKPPVTLHQPRIIRTSWEVFLRTEDKSHIHERLRHLIWNARTRTSCKCTNKPQPTLPCLHSTSTFWPLFRAVPGSTLSRWFCWTYVVPELITSRPLLTQKYQWNRTDCSLYLYLPRSFSYRRDDKGMRCDF